MVARLYVVCHFCQLPSGRRRKPEYGGDYAEAMWGEPNRAQHQYSPSMCGPIHSRQQAATKWSILAARRQPGYAGCQPLNPASCTPGHPPSPLLRELTALREQCNAQANQLEELYAELEGRDNESEELRAQLNLEKFKTELMVDLWAMRVLDNEELGRQAVDGKGGSWK
jgi:hypothetical protein